MKGSESEGRKLLFIIIIIYLLFNINIYYYKTKQNKTKQNTQLHWSLSLIMLFYTCCKRVMLSPLSMILPTAFLLFRFTDTSSASSSTRFIYSSKPWRYDTIRYDTMRWDENEMRWESKSIITTKANNENIHRETATIKNMQRQKDGAW